MERPDRARSGDQAFGSSARRVVGDSRLSDDRMFADLRVHDAIPKLEERSQLPDRLGALEEEWGTGGQRWGDEQFVDRLQIVKRLDVVREHHCDVCVGRRLNTDRGQQDRHASKLHALPERALASREDRGCLILDRLALEIELSYAELCRVAGVEKHSERLEQKVLG